MARKTKANRVIGIASDSMRDWQAEDDLRTLQGAAAVKKDKKRYAKAIALAKDKLQAIAAIAGSDNDGDE